MAITFEERYKKLGHAIAKIKIIPSLRVNTLVTSAENLLKKLSEQDISLKKISWLNNGYWIISTPHSLSATTEHLQGMFYLQESTAQLPVQVLNPQATDSVLDMSASPGGKTTQIAQQMNNKGTIIALEKKPHRIMSLLTNLERMRIKNTIVYNIDGARVGILGEQFDKILLDAPCSGNYANDSEWLNKRKIEDLQQTIAVQKKLLMSAWSVLKSGGILVYSTCSLEPEENEQNIDWMVKNNRAKVLSTEIVQGSPGLTTAFGKTFSTEIAKTRRFWPDETGTQGFYIAKLQKP